MPFTRRDFAGSLLSLAATSGMDLNAQGSGSCLVAGAGVFGAWTAYELRRAGFQVTLIDQYGPGNSRASSGGETRIIRASYGKDDVYTRMALRSLAKWNEFALGGHSSLFLRTGVLWMASERNTYAAESRDALRRSQVSFEDLSPADLKSRYPQIRADRDVGAIFEPDSGALMARQCTRAVVEAFVAAGGRYELGSIVTPESHGTLASVKSADGRVFSADRFVFACGAWLGKVFPELLGRRIFPTRQEVFFFGIPPGDRSFEPPQMPVWIDFGDSRQRGMYGFPDIEGRGFKVAFDLHGPAFDPDTGSRIPSKEKTAEACEYVAERFPALAKAPVIETRVCQYENTSNGDFVIDRHPGFDNVWIAGGGSGHGFKHGPAVGEYAAARVAGNPEPPVEPRFSLVSKDSEQHRAVY